MSETSMAGADGRGIGRLPMAEARFSRQVVLATRQGRVSTPLAQRFEELVMARAAG